MDGSRDLEKLARVRFTLLSESEIKMLRAAANGTTAFCGPSKQDDDRGNDPSESDNWSAERQVRSDLIRWLCIDQAASGCVDPGGIQLHGVRINGTLDLSFATVRFPLRLSRCRLSGDWILNYVEIPSIQLTGAWLRSLTADVAKIKGSVILKEAVCENGKVQLRGAQIGGNLDCGGSTFQNPSDAELPGSGMALNAERAKVGGSVFIRGGFSAKGTVNLFNAEIGGDLDCGGGTFKNSASAKIPGRGTALNAVGAKIEGSVFLNKNFLAEGAVRLFGAEIGRILDCGSGRFQNPASLGIKNSGVALDAEIAKVSGRVFLNNNFMPDGEVRLVNAEIGGNLDCGGSKFQNGASAIIPGSGMALNAHGAKVGGSVLLNNHFSANGEVRLWNSNIGGNLDCGGSTFQNPAEAEIRDSGMALNAEGVKVGGSVFVRYRFSAEGEVSLFNAEIVGDLDCGGGTFQNSAKLERGGIALNAVGAKVGGSVFLRFLRTKFLAEGAVRLFGAEIGRSIDCGGGIFQNPARKGINNSGVALDAEIAKVGGPVTLNSNFSPAGEVRLVNAKIRGDLDCSNSTFQNPANAGTPESGVALNARGINIEGSMLLGDQFRAVGTVTLASARITGSLRCDQAAFESLDLIDASVGSFMDDQNSWPNADNLSLDGFVYGRISGGPLEARKRLEWLKRPSKFARQPYRQLASILGNVGDDLGARQILSEMQRRAWELQRGLVRPIGHLLRFTIGYGYFPLWAVWWLLGVVVIGSGVYWTAYNMGSIVPIQKESYDTFEKNCYPAKEYERFHTIPYSLENSFPLVKLAVQDKWAPAPGSRVLVCQSAGSTSPILQAISAPWFVRWFRWIQICLGWLLTTLFVGGVTGIVRRN